MSTEKWVRTNPPLPDYRTEDHRIANWRQALEEDRRKDSNPKDVAGSARIDMTLLSAMALAEESLAMEEGGSKYGYYNYTVVGVKTRVYVAAAFRHLWKYLMGEDRDPKTGVHHLGSVRACAGIILEAESRNKLTDDRPPANPAASSWLDNMEARVKQVRDTFKEFRPRHFTRDQLDGTGKQIHSAGAQAPGQEGL